MTSIDEKDEIIEEIPVYLSKALAENMFILQYPNKRRDKDSGEPAVVKSCVKPENQEIKIDFELKTASVHYDAFKGEQLATACDGKDNRNEKVSFRSGTMDRQSYISSKPMDNVKKYIVGYYRDKEVHASLVKGIVQMRPNFSHFDKSDKRKKAEQKADQESEGEEEEAKQITVKFARIETDRLKKAREKSFNYWSQKSAEEPWCETLWHSMDSPKSELERQKLFAGSTQTTHAFSLSNPEYIEKLIPAETAYSNIDALLPQVVVSKTKLKALPLSNQIQQILIDAKVVSFAKLTEYIDLNIHPVEKILRTLPTVGTFVQGNWVIQSDVLYPANSVSATNGVPAALMCRARDYILHQFYRDEAIDRKRICLVAQIPTDEVTEILTSIAKWSRTNGWHLLLPPDKEFEEKHQELKIRQDSYWRMKEEMFLEMESDAKSPRRKRKISERK